MNVDLTDMVDNPRESLEIELKEWLDLSDRRHRANIARHIAALSNHGGGYLIFGISDDRNASQNRPLSLDGFNQDTINAITERYLAPELHCHVAFVKSSEGLEYPIVHVPSHGLTPVCAVRDGPRDGKGPPQGIKSSTYYIRTPGPKSEPITSYEQWIPLIRRCSFNDRNALLQGFSQLFPGLIPSSPSSINRLDVWDRDVAKRYGAVVQSARKINWPLPLHATHYQLSYFISHKDESKSISELKNLLEEINIEVRDTVWTGWSMFYPFKRPEIAPAVVPEHSDGSGLSLLEGNLIGNGQLDTSMPDFWRLSPDGRASLVRAYREDERLSPPGRWLSPITVLRETTEIVRHARAFANRFPSATSVGFRCTWLGLEGREIKDFNPTALWSPSCTKAKADRRVSSGEWTLAQLQTSWPEIVASLGCPILTLFGLDCSTELVRRMAPRFT